MKRGKKMRIGIIAGLVPAVLVAVVIYSNVLITDEYVPTDQRMTLMDWMDVIGAWITDTDESIRPPYIDRNEVTDLTHREPLTGKTYIQLLLEQLPEYEAVINDFTFANSYSPDFVINRELGIHTWRHQEILFVDARFRSRSISSSLSFDVEIHGSAEEARKWLFVFFASLSSSADPRSFLSEKNGIVVGDIALGDDQNLVFVRGNTRVFVGGGGMEIPLVEAAQELDAQIIAALEEAAQAQREAAQAPEQ